MLKRAFDIIVSAALLILVAPLLVVIAAGIKLASPRGPVIFRQQRAGRDGLPFTLYKFRSMHAATAPTAVRSPQSSVSLETSDRDPRLFRFGKLLREYHLDELPQLWNVLIGDMSLVGPRPTVPEQVARYTPRQRRRLAVRPGMTGLAQVSGNNALDWDDRIEVDLEYVARAGLLTDLKIMARTVETVVTKRGVYGLDGVVRDKR